MTLTEDICKFIKSSTIEDIDNTTVDNAKDMIVDTVGVTIAASTELPVDQAENRFETEHSTESSSVIGRGYRSSMSETALLNGIMAHTLDFDDNHDGGTEDKPGMGGHPSAPVLPAVLAVAESNNMDGLSLIESFVVGTEIEAALGDIMNPELYENGWHPTSVLGVFGSTASVGKLLDLSEKQLKNAFGLAASMAGGIKGNFGAMAKPYHAGMAARSGIEAASLAQSGFTANENILEKRFGGILNLFVGESEGDFIDHIDRLGQPWQITSPGVWFKRYPCCGSTHSPIIAASSIREDTNILIDDIDEIEIIVHPRRIPHTNDPEPTNTYEAKFSVQYCVATSLMREVWIDDFKEREKIRQYNSCGISKNISVIGDTELTDENEFSATVKIKTQGRTISKSTPDIRKNPMKREDLFNKAVRCFNRNEIPEEAESVVNELYTIDEMSNIAKLKIFNC